LRTPRASYEFLLEVYRKFNEHNGFLLSAGVAFFAFFSLFPLLIFMGIALGFVLEDEATRDQILDFVFRNFPVGASLVEGTIRALIANRSSAGFIALIALLWSGTNLFGSLALGLNDVYEVKETRNLAKLKLVSVGVYFIIIALFLISFAAVSVASVFRDEVLSLVFTHTVVVFAWTIISVALAFVSTLLLFLIVYWLVPNVKLSFRDVWVGALVAGLTWQVTNYLFALYLNAFARTGYGLVYGSLATIVLLLFWMYISAVLLLIGAEVNVLYKRRIVGGVKVFEPRKVG